MNGRMLCFNPEANWFIQKIKNKNKNLNDTIVVQLADENITDHALHDSIRDMAWRKKSCIIVPWLLIASSGSWRWHKTNKKRERERYGGEGEEKARQSLVLFMTPDTR